jgi:uncharacterized protein (DUF2235 family)
MKSWALMIGLVLGCAFSAVAAEDKADAPKVEVKQQQKRLALFLDGTWNEVESNTNVWRMKALCAPTSTDGKSQLAYYEIGVNGVIGGSTGKGLDANIRRAYEWLIENYSDGDEIFIFGFSRGAYTARSLAGVLLGRSQ